MNNKVYVIGGGTVNPIANHLQLCAFAKGGTAIRLFKMFTKTDLYPHLILSDMCDTFAPLLQHLPKKDDDDSVFKTNEDLKRIIEDCKKDPQTRIIVLTAAVCDFVVEDGSDSKPRPDTSQPYTLTLKPADKIVEGIRDKDHKHIFLVAFKNTVNATPQEMFEAGLGLCKKASANLVFVNDTVTMRNMIVTPEEATYADGWERNDALQELVDRSVLRSHLRFTRSTVISGEAVNWNSDLVPDSLRTIVNHCIKNKAYKVFNGATVGHFACKVNDTTFLTSIRRSNFNDLEKVGLVKVITDGPDSVMAYGFKPSVGGQSQRIIFNTHKEMDCILHFHCPLKNNHPDAIESRSQREVECGSHQCGQNTCDGLKKFGNLKAVYLHKHGPNIVFNRNIDPQEVIDFIERNFDLSEKTGGYNLEDRKMQGLKKGGFFKKGTLDIIGRECNTGKSSFKKESFKPCSEHYIG